MMLRESHLPALILSLFIFSAEHHFSKWKTFQWKTMRGRKVNATVFIVNLINNFYHCYRILGQKRNFKMENDRKIEKDCVNNKNLIFIKTNKIISRNVTFSLITHPLAGIFKGGLRATMSEDKNFSHFPSFVFFVSGKMNGYYHACTVAVVDVCVVSAKWMVNFIKYLSHPTKRKKNKIKREK